MNPITLFEQWFSEEKNQNNRKLSNACCLSTVGLDGYPNARFVSLKEIVEDSFVVTGSLSSRKGKEIENHKKAALTFWWTSSERQVRIQGDVTKISQAQAKTYFEQRHRDSKIVAATFAQGEEI
ncbi:pyridoxal 5'-phosphate synthase [Aquimarina sp. 2-A2]|uniref:pyridoxine/pyridoxamine 5'-phosphate oxidase n=1 Tax=Aquimarina sp. 2-A2 TaxID=3382644 RepID=UPI00387EF3C9